MLHKSKTLSGYTLDSLDGEIGRVQDFYFDEKYWTVRYLVADTGNWLRGRLVLISPSALVAAIENEECIVVILTKKQIEESPLLSEKDPVSREYESDYQRYYGWGPYWTGPMAWGAYSHPYPYPYLGPAPKSEKPKACAEGGCEWTAQLRNTLQMSGYQIQATDGEIGHVVDFVIDDITWAIRYLIVDTQSRWQEKKVLVSPQWIDHVSWNESKIFVNLTREAISQSPEYTDNMTLNRHYETKLHNHLGREAYWTSTEPFTEATALHS